MKDRLTIPCPAEKYGAEAVAETMTRVYSSQEQCAVSHGCAEGRVCLLDGYWPEEHCEAMRKAAGTGPGEPSLACCGSSSWEFLGSD